MDGQNFPEHSGVVPASTSIKHTEYVTVPLKGGEMRNASGFDDSCEGDDRLF